MTIKPIKDWENIFLDTSIIINLFLSLKDGVTDDMAMFVNRLIKYLNENNGASNNPRTFYISSITISEIWNKSEYGKSEEIIKALNSHNVTFAAFDNYIAEHIDKNYHSILNKAKLNDFARELSWPEHDLVMAREWILKDTMIVASSDYYDCDVLLTTDVKTMYPVAEKMNVPCAVAYEENFEIEGKYFMKYNGNEE